jgi:hypothetical protein
VELSSHLQWKKDQSHIFLGTLNWYSFSYQASSEELSYSQRYKDKYMEARVSSQCTFTLWKFDLAATWKTAIHSNNNCFNSVWEFWKICEPFLCFSLIDYYYLCQKVFCSKVTLASLSISFFSYPVCLCSFGIQLGSFFWSVFILDFLSFHLCWCNFILNI